MEHKQEMTIKDQIKYLLDMIDDTDNKTLKKLLRIVNGAVIGERIN